MESIVVTLGLPLGKRTLRHQRRRLGFHRYNLLRRSMLAATSVGGTSLVTVLVVLAIIACLVFIVRR